VIEIHIPPLRQRREDIPLLVEHFVRRYAAELKKKIVGLSPEALQALVSYDFPGNVRELENLIERGATLETANVISRASLPELAARAPEVKHSVDLPPDGVDLDRLLADYEREILSKALKQTSGVRKEAARLLGVTFRSLRYRLQKLGIDPGGPGLDEEEKAG
jgi:two-component system response regulator PilR (NtrC family)